MRFRLLGPLKIADGDGTVRLAEGRQRSVLVLLLLHRNEAVSSDRLIDALWGEHPPPTAAKVLQNHVGQLRRALGDRDASRLQTRGHGYALRVEPGELDLDRFEQLARAGADALSRDEPATAAARLREALALWCGPALADVAYESFAQPEIARLEERRLVAMEQRIDADLALGRHADVIADLEALVAEHPLRERPRGQLMIALYRSGRQAEALEAYQDARHALVDELGVEPGPALRELQAAILRQDPALAPPAGAWPRLRRRSRRARALLAAGGVALLAAAAAAIFVERGGEEAQTLLAPDTVGAIDPASGRIVAAVPVAGMPDRLAATDRAIWTIADDSGTISKIDIRRRRIAALVPPGSAGDVAVGAGGVWTIDQRRRQLIEIDPDYARVTWRKALPATHPTRGLPAVSALTTWNLAVGAGAVWVTDGSSRLIRLNLRTRGVTRFDMRRPLNGVTVYRGAVWASSGRTANVLRIEPTHPARPQRIPLVTRKGSGSPYPVAIEAGLGAIWALNANTADVTRIDPDPPRVRTTIPIGVEHLPYRLAVGAGAVWVADGDGTLARVDPATNAVVRTTTVAHGLNDVAVAGRTVWVSSFRGYGAPLQGAPATATATSLRGVRALPSRMCSPLYYRAGDRPRRLIASDLPLQDTPQGVQMTEAIQFALHERGFRAGRHAIAYQACDDSRPTLLTPNYTRRCAPNAHAYARDPSVIGVIGTFQSDCATRELPILNRAPDGPVPMISPSNTYTGLTRAGPGAARGDPDRYRPTGTRNYVRIIAPDDVQGAADALLARQLRLRRAYVLTDGTIYGTGIAAAFRRTAARLGIRVPRTVDWHTARGLVARVRATDTDGVFLAGNFDPATVPRLIRALRRGLPASVKLLAPDGLFQPLWLVKLAGRAAERMTISRAGLPLERLPAPGARFVARFRRAIGEQPDPYSVYAAQATNVLLDAIARSDGTRASVVRELFATRVHNGIIGSFSITPQGDTTARTITIYRVAHAEFRPWKVITPRANLLGSH
jgi:DNA-binding SARP family transcriptional activator/ABC-type branched-subunit amino acid transport system substrate-binding protein/streptogramin lyase